tara:strand:+ start:2623 stop:3018 length:396 start_codon:yes stop_codon:yes gene_type:complete
MKINEKQKRFCEAYLGNDCVNATKAAISAGYSKATAKQQAHQLLKKEYVQQYIDERRSDLSENANIPLKWRIQKLKEVAEAGLERNAMGTYQGLSSTVRAIEAINAIIGIGGDKEATPIKVIIGYEDASKK